MEDTNDPLIGQTISERYAIHARLGEGGVAVVYRGEHTLMKKAVAIKVLKPEAVANPELVERFKREAQAIAQIDHPKVCGATDFGRLDDDRFFLVMELLRGRTLYAELEERVSLGPTRAMQIARQVAAGLSSIHALGILHRDVKPSNIQILEDTTEGPMVKILDFGFARETARTSVTRAGMAMGTPTYIAPEIWRGEDAVAESDLYNLGVVLFECLAGRAPFQGGGAADLMRAHVTDPAPDVRELAPQTPAPLAELVAMLLTKHPHERPPSARALVERLDALISGRTSGSAGKVSSGSSVFDGEPTPPEEVEPFPELRELREETDVGAGPAALRLEPPPGRPPALRSPAALPGAPAASPAQESEWAWLFELGRELGSWTSAGFRRLPAPAKAGLVAALVALVVLPPLLSTLLSADEGGSLGEMAAEMAAGDDALVFAADEVASLHRDLAGERELFMEEKKLAEALAGKDAAGRVDALVARSAELEQSAHFHYLLGLARWEAGQKATAMAAFRLAVDIAPRYAAEPALITRATKELAQNAEPSEHTTRLVEAALAAEDRAPIRDALYGVAVDGHWNGRKRARDLLQKSGQWDQLAPWQQSAINLQLTGKDCERVRKYVRELGASGEPAALPVLEKTSKRSRKGCGFFSGSDCYECMRDDLKKARAALQK